jgi:hypothetical protein
MGALKLKYVTGGGGADPGGGAGGCLDGPCPTVYETDRGTLVVQGYVVDADTAAQFNLPRNETLVEVPKRLFGALPHGQRVTSLFENEER